MARRLVERGVRFVNLVYASWDHHSNLDNELAYNTHVVDQPIAALINDLKQRGLLEDTMVVWGAEFGRTPLGENRGGRPDVTGRDHHPFAFSMFLAGGGLKGGMVHGASDDIGWSVAENIMSGRVRVKGHASESAGASGHGGLLVIEGDASSRCGISMKGCDIVVAGSVGHFSAFMADRTSTRLNPSHVLSFSSGFS